MPGQNGEGDGLEPAADAAAIRDEAAERAIRRLAERGDLTPRQRAAVERLAERLATDVAALFEADRTAADGLDSLAALRAAECTVVASD